MGSAGERAEAAARGEGLRSGWHGRRRWAAVALVLIAAGALGVVGALSAGDRGGSRSVDTQSATSLATVARHSLSAETQVTGTLGYAGDYTVFGKVPGTVTWLPSLGQIIGQGDVLYEVDGAPVVLLYGSSPAYRALGEGEAPTAVTGKDVGQLNHALVALGYLNVADVESTWDDFSRATTVGVQKLQQHLGVSQSGKLALGDVVFLPSAARVIVLQATLGGPATGPLLKVSSTTRVVSVALDAGRQSEIHAGDQVTITLPDGRTTPGTVASVGNVATTPSNDAGVPGRSAPTVPVTIEPTDPTAIGSLDQAPVLVEITATTVQDALAVPVNALLALAGGGYAVEVVDPDGTRSLVSVSPGLFDDSAGLVQVTGSGVVAGQRVVVPAS